MTTPVVSFQKKSRADLFAIPGTRSSIQNAQLLVSTGIPSLDFIIGGGQPVGTVLLLEEDTYKEYSNILLRYFLSEGGVCGHSLLFASLDEDPKLFVSELSAPVTTAPDEPAPKTPKPTDSLKIAWRYGNQNPISTNLENTTTFGHNFDLSKSLSPEVLSRVNIDYWDGHLKKSMSARRTPYDDLLLVLHDQISHKKFATNSNLQYSERNILRIVIQSLGSPFWENSCQESTSKQTQNLKAFFYKLRALLRSAFAVAIITIPSNILAHVNVPRIRHLVDISVELESFTGSDRATNPLFKEYHGLFHIHKISAINSLAPPATQARDLAFKLRRKKFCIEKLHLPPELLESAEREQDEIVPTLSCGDSRKHLYEF